MLAVISSQNNAPFMSQTKVFIIFSRLRQVRMPPLISLLNSYVCRILYQGFVANCYNTVPIMVFGEHFGERPQGKYSVNILSIVALVLSVRRARLSSIFTITLLDTEVQKDCSLSCTSVRSFLNSLMFCTPIHYAPYISHNLKINVNGGSTEI